MVDTRGTEADPDAGSREVEAGARAGLDVVRFAAAPAVVIIVLGRLLRRFRAVVVLRGRLDRFVVVLAVVVVSQGGLGHSAVYARVFARRRAVSGGRITVAGEILCGSLRNILSSGRYCSVLAIIIVVIIVIIIIVDGRSGRGGLISDVAGSSLDIIVASLLVIGVIVALVVGARLNSGGWRELCVGLITGLRAVAARPQRCDLSEVSGVLLIVVRIRVVDVIRGASGGRTG